MGINMHGPWVEREFRIGQGRGAYECVARIYHGSFHRDYTLDNALNTISKGNDDDPNQDMSYEWFNHTHFFVRDADKYREEWNDNFYGKDDFGGLFRKMLEENPEQHPLAFAQDNSWYLESQNPTSGHAGYASISLDQAKTAREIYRKLTEEWNEQHGYDNSPIHSGLELSIKIMEWAQEESPDRLVRMSYCFTF